MLTNFNDWTNPNTPLFSAFVVGFYDDSEPPCQETLVAKASREILKFPPNLQMRVASHPAFTNFTKLLSINHGEDKEATGLYRGTLSGRRVYYIINPDLKFFIHHQDLLTLVTYRSNQLFLTKIIRENKKKFSNAEEWSQKVKLLIESKDYFSLLAMIWAANDYKRERLQLLRDYSAQLPPIFRYEQALAEFCANPNKETYEKKTAVLFKLAQLTIRLDICSIKNPEEAIDFAESIIAQLTSIYFCALENFKTKNGIDIGKIDLFEDTMDTLNNEINETNHEITRNTLPDEQANYLIFYSRQFTSAQLQNIPNAEIINTLCVSTIEAMKLRKQLATILIGVLQEKMQYFANETAVQHKE